MVNVKPINFTTETPTLSDFLPWVKVGAERKQDVQTILHLYDSLTATLTNKSITKAQISDFAHTHVKADITDFSHTHVKADITDFAHSHVMADITDLDNPTIVRENQTNTYTAGMKQTFNMDATNAGLNVGAGVSSDPSGVAEGDLWLHSSQSRLKYRGVSATFNIMSTTSNDDMSSGSKTFRDNIARFRNPANTFNYLVRTGAIVADRDITLPVLTTADTFVFEGHAQTLTNKTISGASNTISGLTTTAYNDDSVTYAKIQNVTATSRFLGRITAGAGDIEELTGTQATTLLDVFTSALKGLVPGSGGGTTNFLRADGSWVAPPGGGNHNLLSSTHSDTVADTVVRGDLIVGNSTPAWARLPRGTTNQQIRVNASGDLEWFTPGAGGAHNLLSADHSDTVVQSPTRGSMIYGNSTPAWDEKVLGTASKRVRSDGTDLDWGWESVVTKTSSATLVDNEEIVLLNPSTSAMTITLPAASGRTGKHYKLKYISETGQPVVIDGNASETIDGLTTRIMEHYSEIMELVCDGSNWFLLASGLDVTGVQTKTYLFEDFLANNDEAGEIGGCGWMFTENGTGTVLQIDGATGHPGIIALTTGATSGNDQNVHAGGSSTLNSFDGDDIWSLTFWVRMNTITSISARIGVGSTSVHDSLTGTSGHAAFQFDPATNASWIASNSGGAGPTTTDTGVDITATTWYKLKIVYDKNAGFLRYYINDVNVANHNTNINGSAMSPAATVQTNTTAARTLDVDACEFYLRSLTRT